MLARLLSSPDEGVLFPLKHESGWWRGGGGQVDCISDAEAAAPISGERR